MTLDKDLLGFLSLEMPQPQLKAEGFMDIVGMQFHENTITRVYAYFLNRDKNPLIADLFLNSLLELIIDKLGLSSPLIIENPKCYLEVMTSGGKRIDLLISSHKEEGEQDDGETSAAIIIENKIFSGINNDLDEYYNSAKALNKIGVLLTIRPCAIPDKVTKGKFINITHTEWIERIKFKGLPSGLSYNEYIYINDFIKNMENLTENNQINEEAKFFFEHSAKVLRAKQTYDAAYAHVIAQLRIVAEKLGWSLYGNSTWWRHIWNGANQSQVYFSIVFDKILTTKPEITIYLEIYKDALKISEELRNELRRTNIYQTLDDDKLMEKTYAHLAFRKYRIEVPSIENLSTFLYNTIKNDFMKGYQVVESYLKNIEKN